MNNLTFDINNTSDFFKKMMDDYEDYKKNRTSSRLALNCAMTSWHLTDWTYNEFNSLLKKDYKKLSDFQNELKQKCPSLQIMHDLTNGTKHSVLTKHKPKIEQTERKKGDFSSDFNRDFNITTLDIQMKDGTKLYFEDEIIKAIFFWTKYLITNFDLKI